MGPDSINSDTAKLTNRVEIYQTHTHTERERRQGYEIGRGWINVIDVDQCDPHWAVAYGSSKFGWQRYMEPI